MAGDAAPAAEGTTAPEAAAPQGGDEPEFVIRKPKPGWVREVESGRFHEVDDVELTLQAYPDRYERAKSGDVVKSKVGWPDEDKAQG